MASPTKPPAPLNPFNIIETEREFEAVIERVQRRETTAARKGFDEERQAEEQAREAAAQEAETFPAEMSPPETIPTEPLAQRPEPRLPEPRLGDWTPFSDD